MGSESIEKGCIAIVSTAPAATTQEQPGLSVFVDNLSEKAGIARRSLQDGRLRSVRGVFREKRITLRRDARRWNEPTNSLI